MGGQALNSSIERYAKTLACIRITVFATFFINILFTSFRTLGNLPVEIMHPPGVMQYVSWQFYDLLFTPQSMLAFKFLILSSLLAATLGIYTRFTSKLSLLLIMFYQGLLRSFGHFNHDESLGMYCLLILAFTPCADKFSYDARKAIKNINTKEILTYKYPIILMQAVLAWVYFSTGILKLNNAGLQYFLPDQLPILSIHHSLDNLHDFQFKSAFTLPSLRQFIPLMTVGAVFWEVTFPIGVFWKKTRWVYLGFGFMFHMSTIILMNIAFFNQLAMYSIFFNWEKILNWRTIKLSISPR